MSNSSEAHDIELGYGNPPIWGRFQKGTSGNPSGRPKQPSEFGSQLRKELNSKVMIEENGKRKAITKLEALVKQLVKRAFSGNVPAARLLLLYHQLENQKIAEQQLKDPKYNPKLTAQDLTDDELDQYILEERAKHKRKEQILDLKELTLSARDGEKNASKKPKSKKAI